MKHITRTVWVLSLVSLLTDTASDMLYPVLPIYLKSIGFSVLLIGILEGVAEALSGLSKGYFGKVSDVTGKRVTFVQFGYSISAVAKPLLGIFANPFWVFFARTLDRFGKGIRTGARDAILSSEATFESKGKVFGFHRAMDTLGAVLGPSLALVFLYFFPENYRVLFFIAFIPGLFAVIATRRLKEKVIPSEKTGKTSLFSFIFYWKQGPQAYRKLVIGLLAFTLLNSSDVFLLLRIKEAGFSDMMVVGLYIFYNLVYALFAYPVGMLADRIGLKSIYIIGLGLFSFVYVGMSFSLSLGYTLGLFFLYGIYAAATEGIAKAWISNISDKKDIATAIGTFSGFQSIFAMLASSLMGLIWFWYDEFFAFMLVGVATFLLIPYFISLPKPIK